MNGTLKERFDSKWTLNEQTGCWDWKASAQRYGFIGTAPHHPETAHRVAWKLYHGEIPAGMHVLHRCNNTLCVNPEHLYLGNAVDNMADKYAANRDNTPRGSDAYQAKLTEAIVVEARQRYSNGESQRKLAEEFGVRRTTMRRALLGLTWEHV